ncbi:hypothetical protein ABPG77_005509 [Micractinium sp. CCAP 211/92]
MSSALQTAFRTSRGQAGTNLTRAWTRRQAASTAATTCLSTCMPSMPSQSTPRTSLSGTGASWARSPPPKDQGECEGCWAFAGVAAIESKILIDTSANASAKPLLDLSEQQLLDCAGFDAGFDSQGCDGGYLYDPFIYASRGLGFLTTELIYPLTGKSGACDDSRLQTVDGASKYELGVDAYATVRPWSAAGLREAVLISPIVVSINAPGLFQFYSGGLWTTADCEVPAGPPSFSSAKTNHAVLVVGFNMTARPPYWIIKNSWGSGDSWDDNGFGMIEMTGLDGKPSWGACSMYFWMLRPAEVLPRQGDPVPPAPETPTLRLMDGNLATQEQYGRLEILVNGSWSTICNRGFDSVNASIACRQLGLGTSGRALAGTPFGQGTGLLIALNKVECTGEEQALQQCGALSGAAGVSGCTHAKDVTIECGDALPDETVRLVSPDGFKQQCRLEVLYKGSWGTICDDGMTDDAASVVCSQLGLGSSGSTIKHAPFWGGQWHNLAEPMTVRLVGGSTKRQGRLEVLQKGLWRTVCDDGADSGLASVVCKQLGLPSNPGRNTTVGGVYYGQGSGGLPIYLHCTGTETSWEQCSTGGLGTRSCTHAEDVGVSCGARLDAMVRLTGGLNARSGRLEVRRNGLNSTWGTMGFDPLDARVVCCTLGQRSYGAVVATSVFGAGSGRIWMSDVACTEPEATLLECTSRIGQACTHAMDVGIRCSDTPPGVPTLRLADGTNSTSGRRELLRDGVWGTICDDYGTDAMATVACRQLGLGTAGILKKNAFFGEGTGPIYMGALNCSGSETRLQDCIALYGNEFSCRHYSDAGVVCYDPPPPLYKFAGKWGGKGDGDGLFQDIYGLGTTRDGDIFACDDATGYVQRFTGSGSFVSVFGAGEVLALRQLSRYKGITQMGSSTDLLVVDRGKQRIERYTLQGQNVGEFKVDISNETVYTVGIVERGGTIYVLECSLGRVSRFATADFRFLGSFGRKELFYTVDMCVTEDGNVVVTNKTSVVAFAANGTLLGSCPLLQPGDNPKSVITAIACSVDGSRAVFVSDSPDGFCAEVPAGGAACGSGVQTQRAGGCGACSCWRGGWCTAEAGETSSAGGSGGGSNTGGPDSFASSCQLGAHAGQGGGLCC